MLETTKCALLLSARTSWVRCSARWERSSAPPAVGWNGRCRKLTMHHKQHVDSQQGNQSVLLLEALMMKEHHQYVIVTDYYNFASRLVYAIFLMKELVKLTGIIGGVLRRILYASPKPRTFQFWLLATLQHNSKTWFKDLTMTSLFIFFNHNIVFIWYFSLSCGHLY